MAIRAEAVDLGEIDISQSDIAARLRDGRLDVTINRVNAYGGGITGTLALVAGDEARLATDLTVSEVQLRPLLNAVAGVDNLEGLGAFRIRLDGRGRSMDALMKSLDGEGALNLSDGAILELNLAAMVRNLTGHGGDVQKTDFSAVTGSFDITDGVLHNTDFSFLGPLIRVIGAGTVDIGHQRQNFRLEPTAVASLSGKGGALDEAGLGIFPVLVTGTWSNPKFQPDLTAAIQGLLNDPDKTLDAVRGLAEGADAGQAAGALLGAVTGAGGGTGSGDGTAAPADAVGKILGSVLGGAAGQAPGGTSDTAPGTAPADEAKPDAIGGLLGALVGGQDRQQAPASQPDGGPPTDAGALAPLASPLPVPAPADREARAAAVPETEPEPDTPPVKQEPEDKLPGFLPPAGEKPDAGEILKGLFQ